MVLAAATVWVMGLASAAVTLGAATGATPQGEPRGSAALPESPLSFGAFTARFAADGGFTLEGKGWPSLAGTWKTEGALIELLVPQGPEG